MDSLTHIALGACIGELYARKSLGKKALIVGAAAQSLPDIDAVASFWLSPAEDLLAHRGFTHSILFALLAAYLLALLAQRMRWLPSMSLKTWTGFFLLELGVHIFLDAFNAYGTAWFEPFSHYRVSFNALFVADPFYTLPILVAFIMLMILPASATTRTRWAGGIILLSSAYLLYALINKWYVNRIFSQALQAQEIPYTSSFSTPTPGNVWLWYLVAKDDKGFYIGYYSVFDERNDIQFEYLPQHKELLENLTDHENLQHLIRFSEGYFAITKYNGQTVFNDLRFGQMLGWEDAGAPFVFYFYLDHPDDNDLLIQRGRFARWNRTAVQTFLSRIGGR